MGVPSGAQVSGYGRTADQPRLVRRHKVYTNEIHQQIDALEIMVRFGVHAVSYSRSHNVPKTCKLADGSIIILGANTRYLRSPGCASPISPGGLEKGPAPGLGYMQQLEVLTSASQNNMAMQTSRPAVRR